MFVQIGLLYLIFLSIGLYFQRRLWRTEKLSAYSIFHATFLLYYVALPAFLFLFSDLFITQSSKFINYIISTNFNEALNSFFISLFVYLIILLTYFIVYHSKKIKHRTNRENSPKFSQYLPMKIVYRFGWFFLIIGGLSVILFFGQLGGVSEALTYADELRYAGTDSSLYYGPFGAILRMLSFLILGAPYCFKVYNDFTKSKNSKMLFYISFIISIMYLIFNSGRATILFFLMPFVLDYIVKKNKNIIMTLLVMVLVVVFTAELFDILFYQMTTGHINLSESDTTIQSNVVSVIGDLSFPYANTLFVSQMNMLYGYRFGADYFIWIFDIIPSRLFESIGINIPKFETLNENTSTFHSLIDPLAYGGVPTDFITSGMRQMNLAGLVVNSLFFSIFAIYIDKLCRTVGPKYNLISIKIKLLFFSFVPNNDLTDTFRGSLFLFILIFMMIVIKNKVAKLK